MSPPKGTDFTKTYQYRAINYFTKKMEKEAFSEQTIKAIVYAAVRYGKKNGLLSSKGVNILNMKSVIEICMKDIKDRDMTANEIIDNVRRSREYLIKLGYTKASDLIKPVKTGGMPRLSYYLTLGEITPVFLALSRTASFALSKIDRTKMPTDEELMRLRIKLLMNNDIKSKINEILGSDLNTAGLPRSLA